jgi:hypothetical protein
VGPQQIPSLGLQFTDFRGEFDDCFARSGTARPVGQPGAWPA